MSSPLLQLPRELRDQIIEDVLIAPLPFHPRNTLPRENYATWPVEPLGALHEIYTAYNCSLPTGNYTRKCLMLQNILVRRPFTSDSNGIMVRAMYNFDFR
jgi:hypothetical protein